MKDQESPSQEILAFFDKSEYECLRKAGQGEFVGGSVYFALPKTALSQLPEDPSSEQLEALKTELVAIKFTAKGEDPTQEIKNLKHIHDKASGRAEIRNRFLHLGDHGENWLQIGALEPGMTLSAFVGHIKAQKGVLPHGFIAHVFLDLLRTLEFLHKECGLAHCDLHGDNVLIDLTTPRSEDKTAFPNLVLIDFGTSVLEAEASFLEDVSTFCSIILEVAGVMQLDYETGDGEGSGLESLKDFMEKVTKSENEECLTLAGIRGQFEKSLLKCKKEVTEKTVDEINGRMMEAVAVVGKTISLQELQDAVKRPSSG